LKDDKCVVEEGQIWVVEEEDNKRGNSMLVVYRKEEEGSSSKEVEDGSSSAAADEDWALPAMAVVEDPSEETKIDYSVMAMGSERMLLGKKRPHDVMVLHLADVFVQRYFD
jgi:hypothetical protein